MKLIVQIPCFNEEATLRQTVLDIPKAIDACLRLGADVIVNTDGDNQYAGKDIPKLVAPIIAGEADMVIGDRRTATVPHLSSTKKLFQAVGSCVVRRLSSTSVPDTVSGFRAFSRDAALQMNIVSPFSYTVETIIAAGRKRLAIASVPIATNGKTRSSRLFKSIPQFIANSVATMLRIYTMYCPLRVFCLIAVFLGLVGVIPIARFLYFVLMGNSGGHIQSLVLGGAFLTMGFVAFLFGMIADLISFNRQLIETTLEKVRRLELEMAAPRSDPSSNEDDREPNRPYTTESRRKSVCP